MKKVELITLQNVPNYGSVLQAYATQEIIKKMGYRVEIIDYFPNRMTKKAMLLRIKNKGLIFKKSFIIRNIARMVIFPSYMLRFNIFKKFKKKYLNTTSKIYKNNSELLQDIPKADIYCTGSDQVWNSSWNEGIDKALFLDFVPKNKKCIAFSASFGKRQLELSEIQDTKKLLIKYKYISLREKSGVKILNDLGIHNAINVLDPTLLLTLSEWEKISFNRFKGEKYIFVYNLNRNKKIDHYARNLSNNTGLKIKYLSYQIHDFYKQGKMYCNPAVEIFLDLIKNAEYIITDSFHAIAFSLTFNREFVIVYPNKFSTRLKNILELTDLQNRVAMDENDLAVINEKINYKKVNKILNDERCKSMNWLKNALNDGGKNVY